MELRKAIISRVLVNDSERIWTKVSKGKRRRGWRSREPRHKLPDVLYQWSRAHSAYFQKHCCATPRVLSTTRVHLSLGIQAFYWELIT